MNGSVKHSSLLRYGNNYGCIFLAKALGRNHIKPFQLRDTNKLERLSQDFFQASPIFVRGAGAYQSEAPYGTPINRQATDLTTSLYRLAYTSLEKNSRDKHSSLLV